MKLQATSMRSLFVAFLLLTLAIIGLTILPKSIEAAESTPRNRKLWDFSFNFLSCYSDADCPDDQTCRISYFGPGVPKDFLLQILGEERITKFVIQEIINSTFADYAKKESLTVKDNKITTTQTAEELRSLFVPGKEFGFNATLELENAATEASSSDE